MTIRIVLLVADQDRGPVVSSANLTLGLLQACP